MGAWVRMAVAVALLWTVESGAAAVAQDTGLGMGVATPPSLAGTVPMQTLAEALAQDAGEYAFRTGVGVGEAMRRLLAQEETVATTDALAERYRDRLAGISVEHFPDYRIVVLLTGVEPVPDQVVVAGGMDVPIVFRTGAGATGAAMVAAITAHQATIRAALRHPPGMGVDPRLGALVVMVQPADAALHGVEALQARFAALTGVPVRVRVLNRDDMNAAAAGGSRVVGVSPVDGRRYACTTGFVVTDGARSGVVTAAHCPDTLTYYAPDRTAEPLGFVGQWGWGFQDVQVHVSGGTLAPLFYADTDKSVARAVTGQRRRASTRAGDVVCHRGERTGYSCAEVELVDFAPSGDLCGGACSPTWVTVAGPGCNGGDSGGPVFNGGTAFGILKGSNYRPDGTCGFYYYMSTDYLPAGWSLVHDEGSVETNARFGRERGF